MRFNTKAKASEVVVVKPTGCDFEGMVRIKKECGELELARALNGLISSGREAPAAHFRLVARIGGKCVGFVLYGRGSGGIVVIELAVAPKHRRAGVGRAIVSRLFSKVSGKSPVVTFWVHERNVGAQLFLRNVGAHYYCSKKLDGIDSAYKFKYEVRPMSDVV